MRETDIRRFLGNSFVRIPAALVGGLPLPEESKAFLSRVGLPTRDGQLFPFFQDEYDFATWRHADHDYLVLADQRGQKLALQLPSGEIYIIDSRNELPTRFVNSNVAALVCCLALYAEAQASFLASQTADTGQIASQLRRRISEEDARALDNEEHWWSVILDETEQGLISEHQM
jgi:hypothetical protein